MKNTNLNYYINTRNIALSLNTVITITKQCGPRILMLAMDMQFLLYSQKRLAEFPNICKKLHKY